MRWWRPGRVRNERPAPTSGWRDVAPLRGVAAPEAPLVAAPRFAMPDVPGTSAILPPDAPHRPTSRPVLRRALTLAAASAEPEASLADSRAAHRSHEIIDIDLPSPPNEEWRWPDANDDEPSTKEPSVDRDDVDNDLVADRPADPPPDSPAPDLSGVIAMLDAEVQRGRIIKGLPDAVSGSPDSTETIYRPTLAQSRRLGMGVGAPPPEPPAPPEQASSRQDVDASAPGTDATPEEPASTGAEAHEVSTEASPDSLGAPVEPADTPAAPSSEREPPAEQSTDASTMPSGTEPPEPAAGRGDDQQAPALAGHDLAQAPAGAAPPAAAPPPEPVAFPGGPGSGTTQTTGVVKPSPRSSGDAERPATRSAEGRDDEQLPPARAATDGPDPRSWPQPQQAPATSREQSPVTPAGTTSTRAPVPMAPPLAPPMTPPTGRKARPGEAPPESSPPAAVETSNVETDAAPTEPDVAEFFSDITQAFSDQGPVAPLEPEVAPVEEPTAQPAPQAVEAPATALGEPEPDRAPEPAGRPIAQPHRTQGQPRTRRRPPEKTSEAPSTPITVGRAPIDRVPSATVARFENLTGIDLGFVPLNRAPEVARTASQLGARAYTQRGSVHVPDDLGGLDRHDNEALVMHELAHVAQERSGAVPSEPDEWERQAALLEQAFRGEPVAADWDGSMQELTGAPTRSWTLEGGFVGVPPSEPPPHDPSSYASPPPQRAPISVGPPQVETSFVSEAAAPPPEPADDSVTRELVYAEPSATPGESRTEQPDSSVVWPRTLGEDELDAIAARVRPRVIREDLDLEDPHFLERLARDLYGHVRGMLRRELIADRERAGVLTEFHEE